MPVLDQPIAAIIEGHPDGEPVNVVSPANAVTSAISGQITVTTAGTEVQGSSVSLPNGVYIKALSGNTGKVYVGNDGSNAISSTTGYELAAGQMILVQVDNLNKLWFDAATNGDKFCWMKA
jgi:hypothetical protein